MLFNIHRPAIRHVFRVIDGVALHPGLNQATVSVLINWRDGCLLHQDFLRHVVVRISRLRGGFQRRLLDDLIVGRVIKAGDIAAVG